MTRGRGAGAQPGAVRGGARLALVLAAAASSGAWAAEAGGGYPLRAIRMVVPYAPGGPIEVIGRLIGQRLGDAWGHPVVVDNRPGASGLIGTDLVAKAPKDGYTLLIAAQSQASNASMFKKLPYDTLRDFAPITQVARGYGLVLVVPPKSPFGSVKELIAQAKANPGRFSFGSAGAGNSTYVAPALMMAMTGIKLLHVPYKGISLALNDVMGGQVHMAFASAIVTAPLIKAGRLRGLAIGGGQRSPSLPDVPTLQEEGLAEFDLGSWFGMWFPAGTPRDRIQRMYGEIARVQALPEMKQRFDDLGLVPTATPPEEFGRFVQQQVAFYARVAKLAGIEPQ
jgi:tripartite-type tricarboxylate transporter receptor subunit TctC